jgi:ATP-dependent phosphofructokinase / diphosphate-dependent phosphofructokinase
MAPERKTLGILVGGGPAPGINAVIAAATIEAINCGLRVTGLLEGFRWLVGGDTTHTVELDIRDVSRIHLTGGSILRTSRTNPARDAQDLERAARTLEELGIRYLLCIGGDDTTYGATRIAEHTGNRIGVATVPKTIDNDLPLPDGAPTFGFETARATGTAIIESLMEDARTTGRWYLAVTMGRKSGSLALGMCKSAGATLAVIPEEFGAAKIDLNLVFDTIAGAIIKRKALGRDDGVALVAEGIVENLDPRSLKIVEEAGRDRDAYGHVHIAEVPIGTILRDGIRVALAQLGAEDTVVQKDIGYELRCVKPVPFDVEYARTLGYGAVRYLLAGGSGALIAISNGRVTPLRFDDLKDPQTGRVRVRSVDVKAESYEMARSYMIRLEYTDFEEPWLSRLAEQTKLSAQAFKDRFLPAVKATSTLPQPSSL